MITKFKNIKNLAVFKDFDWDVKVRDKGNNIITFKKLNVFYGRNYSGKTTLSRIIRALETGKISDKYENPECCVCITDNDDITQLDFKGHDKTIRVFNEDFVEDNLRFIVNPDEDIEPFAILGVDNTRIEGEIKALKEKLGSNEEDKETALYKELKHFNSAYTTASKTCSDASSSLEKLLKSKATDKPKGIKYQSEKFGDQNYNINKIKIDIVAVLEGDYSPLTEEEKTQAENVLTEKVKNTIPELSKLDLSFSELKNKTKEYVSREIGRADKIDELVKNAVLNRWVKEGKELHQGKTDTCSFCNSKILENRWNELDRHFDEESEKLESEINQLIEDIESEKELITSSSGIKKEEFYSRFHTDVETLSEEYKATLGRYNSSLASLENQLKERIKDILNSKTFIEPNDLSSQIESTRAKFDEIRIKSNEYSENLETDQSKAKNDLRLKEIYDFVQDIKYNDQKTKITTLEEAKEVAKDKRDKQQIEIDNINKEISDLQKQLKDESKGADKVNEYLNDFFGHDFLSLEAIEFDDEDSGNKKFRFEIHREGKKAYHLSEGEKSLIAFCYFIAKLQDIETKSKKPIIWIDDPISSLDSNHIFFIYSLINAKVCAEDDLEQLFISTHNLNFLKYLQRLPIAKKETQYLIIERKDKESFVSEMPEYIKKNVTEFNHLFKQIVECSRIESITDDNYTLFYNFGNSARKFLEIYLFYKYPDNTDDSEKMKKFFGDDDIPVVLANRINNEYSHLAGIFERGQQPVEVPEMKKAAELIVKKIKEHDEDQYEALLASVGMESLNKAQSEE